MSCSARLRILAAGAVIGWALAVALLIDASVIGPSRTDLDEWALIVALAAATVTVWYAVVRHASQVSRAFEYGMLLGTTTPAPRPGLAAPRERERESRVARIV